MSARLLWFAIVMSGVSIVLWAIVWRADIADAAWWLIDFTGIFGS